MGFVLPSLGFDYSDLEPHIDAQTMQIHHSKHHQGYVDKLNGALENHKELMEVSIEKLLGDLENLPDEISGAVINNGGGHANHSLFWKIIKPGGSNQPSGDLLEAINEAFGSFSEFKEKFAQESASRFGSGWGWLMVVNGKLAIESTPNQDSPLMHGDTPILGLDVWEHAYYLNYQNRRPDYIEAFWNVVNWDAVDELYMSAK